MSSKIWFGMLTYNTYDTKFPTQPYLKNYAIQCCIPFVQCNLIIQIKDERHWELIGN